MGQGALRDQPYPSLGLTRQSPGQSSVIAFSDSVPALDDGVRHTVQWRRTDGGTLIVLVDGAEVMRAIDRSIRNPFDGVSILNRGGDYAISHISIDGTGF